MIDRHTSIEAAEDDAGAVRCVGCGAAASPAWLCADCDAQARTSFVSLLRGGAGADGAYDDSLFERLEMLEPSSFWFRSRNRLVAWVLRSYFPTACDVLEIGCGTGFVLAAVGGAGPQLRPVGGELSESGLRVARRRLGRVPLLQVDARDLQVVSSFDAVLMLDVLEHIHEDELALAEAARAVRPGGGLVLMVPQHPWLWSASDAYAEHVRRYQRADLVAKVERAGLRVVRATSFVSVLLPILVLSRQAGARSDRQYTFEREFRLPRALDRALEAVMSAERALIMRGVSLPAGGSLLVIGRKPTRPS